MDINIYEIEKDLRNSVKSNTCTRKDYDEFIRVNNLVNYFTCVNEDLIIKEILDNIDHNTYKFNTRFIPSIELEDSLLYSDKSTIDRCIDKIIDTINPTNKMIKSNIISNLNNEIYERIILKSYESKVIVPPRVKLDNNEIFNDDWIDNHSLLPRMKISDFLSCPSNDLSAITNGKSKVVFEAPTGSGKTLRLAQAIAYDKTYYGVILTHSYNAGRELYSKIIELNPTLRDDVYLFYHKGEMY